MNILVYTISPFDFKCGGLVVQYELCSVLDTLRVNIRISAPEKINNSIFCKYYNNDFDLNNTIVIYGETIEGNPLNAPYVARWILAPLGLVAPYDNYKTWNKTDLVYYFNSEEKITNNPDKLGNLYKILNVIYVNPAADNYYLGPRKGTCFTIRKGYGKNFKAVHPPGSFEIDYNHTQLECIKIFNNHKYFISYDSLTFLSVISALCGCISIVVKVDGLSKQDWLNTTAAAEYLKETGETMLYGIAYGADDLHNAINSIHLAKDQWQKIVKYCKDKYVLSFIEDINNWDNNINTIQTNYV